MLFHLFSPSANGYVTLPAGGGAYSVSTQPVPGTVFDLCGSHGRTIDRGLRYNREGTAFITDGEYEGGYDTLASNDIVTLRAPNGRYVTPRNQTVTLEPVSWAQAQFKIRKVSGSSGSTIRHGDMIALGAVQPYDPSRSPSTQQCRWLQADPEDNNPATNPVILGGLSTTFGGASQQFRFLEGNLLLGEATLKISDRIPPGEAMPAGDLVIRLSHEGLPNASTVLVKFNTINAASFAFGSGNAHVLPSGGEQFSVAVPSGARSVRVPVRCVSPANFDACARLGAFFNNNSAAKDVGSLSIVDQAMTAWSASGRHGTQPHLVTMRSEHADDFIKVSLANVRGGADVFPINDDGGQVISAGNRSFSIRVASTRGLPPLPGGYYLVPIVTAFPAPAFATTEATPLPIRVSGDPAELDLDRDGSFKHTTRFQVPAGISGLHLFCVTIHVLPRRQVAQPVRLNRRFGLVVLSSSG
jgi:hypothetical protein